MTLPTMKKKKLKGNQKLRAVYGNAASALTVQFNDLKTKRGKPRDGPNVPPFDLSLQQTEGKKPP